jgi:hypothetical protein
MSNHAPPPSDIIAADDVNSKPDDPTAATSPEQSSDNTISLKWLIEDVAHDADADSWDLVRERCRTHPQEIAQSDDVSGRTILHQLCATPNSPDDVLQTVVEAYPAALTMQELQFLATPLHVLMWSTLRSTSKVQILLQHMEPKDVLTKNRFSGTALHSACGMNATLQVIQLLVAKNPQILLERTRDYSHTSLTALWDSHLQSIPGHMQIARILNGEDVQDDHFQRFWAKLEYIASESFKLSPECPTNYANDQDLVLLGLLNLRARINAVKVALKWNPEWARIPDGNGNYPLHLMVIRRPYRLKDIEVISELIQAYPDATLKRNNDGHAPIFLAIRDKMAWEEGLNKLVEANPEVLSFQDRETGLYPFLLAASEGGTVAVNTTYQLLTAKPYLVKDAMMPS